MSQRAINTALQKLADNNPELIKINITSKKAGHTLVATLNQPQVLLPVSGGNFSSLKYQLRFASGTLNLNWEEEWVSILSLKCGY